VQDDSGGIDNWTQGMSQRLSNFDLQSVSKPWKRVVEPQLVEMSGRNFLANSVEHGSGRIGNDALAFSRNQLRNFLCPEQFVDGGKLAKEIGLGISFHDGDYPTSTRP
jgi:hypothetical protein